jgi:hypothetical protein
LAPIFDAIYDEYHSSEQYAKEAILRSYLKILLVKAERIKKRSLVLQDGKSTKKHDQRWHIPYDGNMLGMDQR